MTVLSTEDVARHCHNAGFTGSALVTIVAIAKAESGFDADAVGDSALADDTWGPSVGLLQVRSLREERGTGGERDELANHDPAHNARAGWSISNHGGSFHPWSVYQTQAYLQHLEAVEPACRQVEAPTAQRVLRLKDRGDDVAELQRDLAAAGFPCDVDGDFGPLTRQAVLAFQSARSLDRDGVVGPITWGALGRSVAPVG